ncbi:MAG TPA: FAD-dependent oxidoreductase [Acidimicrobiales bacterium]|nr:FAD-dependent oxidoreductase [Acidimicrobiales bacterium]
MTEGTCDVAVVGGGLVGTTLAYELVTRGADVVLVDEHHPGRASDAGAGILSPETTWNPDDGWFSFGRASAGHYRELVARLADDGAHETGFAECGLLSVAVDPGEDAWFATCADLALRRSPDTVTEVTSDEARALFPPLGPVRRSLHNRAAARVDGRLMTAAVLHGARRHGLRRLDAKATGLRTRSGRVVGVDSETGALSCGAVAIAGGAWSQALGRQLGVPLPVEPVKGQIVHMQLPEVQGGVPDSGDWPIVSPVLNHYLVAWPGGRVACGGTYEPDARFDTRATIAGLDELLRACLTIAPGLADASVVDVRVGLRPVSKDDLPVLGPVPGWENVHLVTGHGTEGLLLGPYSAALVARCLGGEPVPHELLPFSAARFVK